MGETGEVLVGQPKPEAEAITLDDRDWEALFELTGGAAAPCYQCGVCTATCPWGLVREGAPNVRLLMRQAQLGMRDGEAALWLCTTCAQCEASCPRGVPVTEVLLSLRRLAWERNQAAWGLPSVLWSVYWNENPWQQPPSQRAGWARDLAVPRFDPQAHEVLLYTGCTASYDRRAQQVARALVRVLRAAGVNFGTLGEGEPCCGEAALSVGQRPYFEEVAWKSGRVLAESGARRLVAVSPHCYDVFKNHYPALTGENLPEPLHYTQYLAELVAEGRLEFQAAVERRVTFQDPCYLGRRNGEYEAPRRVLQAIPGVRVVEMERSLEAGLCCGGGGGRMWLETPPGERFAGLRMREARETGAGVLATACPFCAVCLEEFAGAEKLAVLDVAEVAAQALEPPRNFQR